MKFKTFWVSCILSVLVLHTQYSSAQDGFYIGSGVALNQTTSENIYKTYWSPYFSQGVISNPGTQVGNSTGLFTNFGYQFNDYLASEVNYLWSNNQIYTPVAQDAGNRTFLGSQNIVSANALFLYPFTDWFNLKIRGGIAWEEATMTDYVGSPMTDGFTSVIGLGGSFYIFKHISLDIDYIGYGVLFPLNLNYHSNGNQIRGQMPTNVATVTNNDLILGVNYHF